MSNIPTKITQISKDFNIKSKDVLDTFKDLGIEKKSGGSVDADEFELFFQTMTKKHQIKDLEAYRSGKATIKVVEEKKETAPKAEEKPAAAPAPKAEPKVEQKPQPKVEAKVEQKPQPKPEVKQPQQPQKPQQFDRKPQQPDARTGEEDCSRTCSRRAHEGRNSGTQEPEP